VFSPLLPRHWRSALTIPSLFIQVLETLQLRQRHSENALALACSSRGHPAVSGWATRAFRRTRHARTMKRYLKGGFGGVLTSGCSAARGNCEVIAASKLFSLVANVGDARV